MNRPKRSFDGWAEAGGVFVWAGRSFFGDAYEIAAAQRLHEGAVLVAKLGPDARVVWERADAGAEVPTLLTLPSDMLEGLLKAASSAQPPSTTMQRHLDDAIVVRDRLLTLVEARTGGDE